MKYVVFRMIYSIYIYIYINMLDVKYWWSEISERQNLWS